jgi:hypothetical protein
MLLHQLVALTPFMALLLCAVHGEDRVGCTRCECQDCLLLSGD